MTVILGKAVFCSQTSSTSVNTVCREKIRKSEVKNELHLVRAVKDNKKSFCNEYIGQKRKTKEDVGPL